MSRQSDAAFSLYTVKRVDEGLTVKAAYDIVENAYKVPGDGLTWNYNAFGRQWHQHVGQYLPTYHRIKKDGTLEARKTYVPNSEERRIAAFQEAVAESPGYAISKMLVKITSSSCKSFSFDFSTEGNISTVSAKLYRQLTDGLDIDSLDPEQFIIQQAAVIKQFFTEMENDLRPVLEDDGDAEFDFGSADEDEEEEED